MRMDMMRAETLDYAAAMGKLLDSSSLQWRVPSASTPSLANTGIVAPDPVSSPEVTRPSYIVRTLTVVEGRETKRTVSAHAP